MHTSPFSVNKLRLAFLAFWVIWTALHIVVMQRLGFEWSISIADGSIMNVILASACILVSNNLRYYLPQQDRYWYILIWSIGFSAASIITGRWILMRFFGDYTSYVAFLADSLLIRSAFAFLMVGCMATISLLWYTVQEQQANEQRKADAERLARDAELFNLRQQLQPHFLFNCLNSVNALIGSRPDEARLMIQQLSEFLRGTLKKDDQQWVSLSDELKHLQLYLAIEKVRFGHRLLTDVSITKETEAMVIPPLLLQPIVENAIKFGLYDTTGETGIRILTRKLEGLLVIEVQNPYDPETSTAAGGTGFGLNSVKRRLFLLFGRSDLIVTSATNGLFTATIKIPQHHD